MACNITVDMLPGDLLADILHRLAPRWLARSRCVCRSWRAIVDDRCFLRADLLPLSLAGIFVHFSEHTLPELFARPGTGKTISGSLDFLPVCAAITDSWRNWINEYLSYDIQDHYNGLLLVQDHVVNPATRRWNVLPPCPANRGANMKAHQKYLSFDPTISTHYEVFMVPRVDREIPMDELEEQSEWPPSAWILNVFSSRSGAWMERAYVGEGDAAGTVGEMRMHCPHRGATVYWRGAIYVYCHTHYIIRISLSEDKYHVIKPPPEAMVDRWWDRHLAKSEKGVYFASLHDFRLRVWILDEPTQWILKHDNNFGPMICSMISGTPYQHGPCWIIEDINYNLFLRSSYPEEGKKLAMEDEDKFGWDSDDGADTVTNDECADQQGCSHKRYFDIEILGFHPFKEVVFLSEFAEKGFAYHLKSSKVQGLGSMKPTSHYHFKELPNESSTIESFMYTPYWFEELLPGTN